MKKRAIATIGGLCLLAFAIVGYGARANPIPGLVSGVQQLQAINIIPQSDYMYWIAECEIGSWPVVKDALGDDGITVLAHSVTSTHAWGLLYKGGNIATLEAHSMGIRVAGYYTWIVRAPYQIRTVFLIPECPVRRYYSEVLALPVAAKDWVLDRSTCLGTATWDGNAYTEWPCIWASERVGSGTILGVAPGVMSGGTTEDASNDPN